MTNISAMRMAVRNALQAEINAIIDEKLAAGEPVEQQWVVETVLANHAEGARSEFDEMAASETVKTMVERFFALRGLS